MKKKLAYNVRALVDKLFPCHTLKMIVTEHAGEEFYREEDSWYIAYPEINRVHFYYNTFSESQTIYSDEGEEAHAISKNLTYSDDKLVLRINQLSQISPVLNMIDDTYCEVTEELEEWIWRYVVTSRLTQGETLPEFLKQITRTYQVDYVTKFDGCCSPVYTVGSGWAYSSKSLEMTGNEVAEVLKSIDNELLCKKIECLINHYGTKRYHK